MSRINTYTTATSSYPFVISSAPGSTASGSTILLNSAYVPQNTFKVGDTIEILMVVTDNSIATTGQVTCYWNVGTTSTVGAKILGINLSAASTYQTFITQRYIHIASPTQSYVLTTGSFMANQTSGTTGKSTENIEALTTVDIDWTQSGYVFVNGSATGMRCQYIYLNRK